MLEYMRSSRSKMKKTEIYFFIGTTAELIKLAPVIKELKARKIHFKIIASAQNALNFHELKSLIGEQNADYTFVFKPLKLPKNIYLQFMIWAVKAFTNHILFFRNEFKSIDKKKSYFIVHGDTVSSLMGATIAKFFGIRLVHIESGLRSYNFFEPFPEESFRFIVSKLADIHFCPNDWAVNNLKGSRGVKIDTKNNTLIESLLMSLKVKQSNKLTAELNKKKFFLLILHRQEHMFFQKSLTKKLLRTFTEFANKDLRCVLVLHKLTSDFLEQENLTDKIKSQNVLLIPRVPYVEFMDIMKSAEFVATDGGSNQEEAYYLGKPCLVLRNVTERIEGLGENTVLSGGDENVIKEFINNYKKYQRKPVNSNIPPSKIIVDYLVKSQ